MEATREASALLLGLKPWHFWDGGMTHKRFYEKVIKLRPEKLLDMTV